MLLRILTMHVDPDRVSVSDWMRFTRDVGFPGMLARKRSKLERFRASAAMRSLSEAAAPFTVAPAEEALFDVLDDPPE
jgi:hypothetical protein